MRWTFYPIATVLGVILLACSQFAFGAIVILLSVRPARTGE